MRKLSVFALLAVVSCVAVNKSVLDRSYSSNPVPPSDVKVYFSDEDLPEYERVAILNASGDSGWTQESEMIDKLRAEAGKLGANAVILRGMEDPGAGEKFMNALLFGRASGKRKGEALAVYMPSVNED